MMFAIYEWQKSSAMYHVHCKIYVMTDRIQIGSLLAEYIPIKFCLDFFSNYKEKRNSAIVFKGRRITFLDSCHDQEIFDVSLR